MGWLKHLVGRYRAHLVGKVEGDRAPVLEIEWQTLPWFVPLGLLALAAALGVQVPTWLMAAATLLSFSGAIYVGKVMISTWLEHDIARALEEERRKTLAGERKV